MGDTVNKSYLAKIGDYNLSASFTESTNDFAWINMKHKSQSYYEIVMVYLYDKHEYYTLVAWDYIKKDKINNCGKYIGKDNHDAHIYVFNDIDDYIKNVDTYRLGSLSLGVTMESCRENSKYDAELVADMINNNRQEFYEFINEFRAELILR